MYLVWGIVGAVIGAFVGEGFGGGIAGFAIGFLWGRTSQLRRELDDARRAIERLETASVTQPAVDVGPSPAVSTVQPPTPPPMPEAPTPWPAPEQASRPREALVEDVRHEPAPLPSAPREPLPPPGPAGPTVVERLTASIKRWFTEGNVPVKVGMLVLFAGIAAFLKYASDSGLLRVPVSVRLSLVALAAIAGVAFGWRQRDRRRAFALSLQGGAIGVLVMTVFAAYRLYGVLPAGATFALLIVFVGALGVLAVVQDALALAVLGLVAGFAAPIIASSGHGNHVALFSYYAVLNLGILGIAWKRAWRVLNVLGFIATFGVGTAWGVLSYNPALFASTEPFLILHFLLYVAVPWLHVLRSPRRERAILDGCLMFGNPIACLLLQGALLDWQPMPLAISALVAAAIYVAIAFAIRRRDDMTLLRETWAVLAVAFATLAVPLALSASVTASVFALEGAGLIWLGFRQGRRLPRWSGVGLQLVAGAAWVLATVFHSHYNDTPFLNAVFIGSLLLVVGAVAGVWQFDRHGASQGVSSLARIGLLVWAVLWWMVAFAYEIETFVVDDRIAAASWLALLSVTGCLLALACRRVRKLDLGVVLAFGLPLALLAGISVVLSAANAGIQWLLGWPLLAVAIGAVAGVFALRAVQAHRVASVTLWWLHWLAVFTTAIALAIDPSWSLGQGWQMLACALPTLVLAALVLWGGRWLAMSLADRATDIRYAVGACATLAIIIVGLQALSSAGNPKPLPFLPVLNPLDLLLLAVLAFAARAMSDRLVPGRVRTWRPAVLAAMFFVIATSMTLRAVHHLGGVPWNDYMPRSSLAELSLTVVWSAIGVVAWVLGSRRGQRLLWLAGAATMALVLLKLLLVDRGHLGNLFGIASFIAYGLLCTVIGYLAPAPPRVAANDPSESPHAS
ncbi:DUF2339 domain-containing protein [Luteibacter sp. UNCMF366Tsu5.1]|uniref:DUF2339 domain-containing protein n=1 Tax=Luteibacter sp. UNCMF366Tsu5.1 TaxID=1502758 RepID=UPI0009087E32|nr:DUF2339 domain-containing protein [Luteibacter sp. UNCMF366Tsu5.1]SFW28575.1 Uncharacterized membrane protein [Luteibacter sp. UNCMF366Tsu5.1]